jgi:hypothetical protein
MKCLTKSSVIKLWVEHKSLNGKHISQVATIGPRIVTIELSTVRSG